MHGIRFTCWQAFERQFVHPGPQVVGNAGVTMLRQPRIVLSPRPTLSATAQSVEVPDALLARSTVVSKPKFAPRWYAASRSGRGWLARTGPTQRCVWSGSNTQNITEIDAV